VIKLKSAENIITFHCYLKHDLFNLAYPSTW